MIFFQQVVRFLQNIFLFYRLLQNLVQHSQVGFPNQATPDYRIGLLLNAYSSNQVIIKLNLLVSY